MYIVYVEREDSYLVEKRRRHHRGGLFIAIESKFGAGRVARANVGIHRVADSRHVWALRQIVSSATRPHQDVVGEVPHNFVGALFGRRQAASCSKHIKRKITYRIIRTET